MLKSKVHIFLSFGISNFWTLYTLPPDNRISRKDCYTFTLAIVCYIYKFTHFQQLTLNKKNGLNAVCVALNDRRCRHPSGRAGRVVADHLPRDVFGHYQDHRWKNGCGFRKLDPHVIPKFGCGEKLKLPMSPIQLQRNRITNTNAIHNNRKNGVAPVGLILDGLMKPPLIKQRELVPPVLALNTGHDGRCCAVTTGHGVGHHPVVGCNMQCCRGFTHTHSRFPSSAYDCRYLTDCS